MATSIPTQDQLLQAIRAHLRDHLLARLSGADRYQLQVAIKALDIIVRERERGEAADRAEFEHLAAILDNGDARSLAQLNTELSESLRTGRLLPDDPALLNHLRAITWERLSIDNPDFSFHRATPDDPKGDTPPEGVKA